MPKANTNLVIVESPSKAKTIGKYLGSEYEVKACMGHLRDLPKSTMGIDFENNFTPNYQPVKGKEDIINDLKKSAKNSDKIFLATDPDREGEAISWHLQALLEIPNDQVNRVTFNEITKGVVTKAIKEPRAIDQNLVDAQQARRMLDRIVGYELSPLLWKKVRRGLSAGRVQSVATRLVVDREEEINAFQPQEYWTLDVKLNRVEKSGSFTARFYGDPKKRELASGDEVAGILQAIDGKPFRVKSVKRTEKKRSPAPPFTTSTLQQEASRKLGMTPKRTMALAQQLYEGVEISGIGAVGLITYMRTDSQRISDEALQAAKEYILNRWGERHYFGEPHRYKTKSAAQDAHEAIRPSDVNLDPERVKDDLNKDQFRLYKLIWERFTASQMACALYDNVAIEAECENNVFRANHQSLKFAGFTALYEEGKDDEQEEIQSPLPDLCEGEPLTKVSQDPEQHFTQPPARYTEATLVRAMEEKGVGRPSTYASIISTIQDRDYVIKKEKRLWPTPLGEVVTGLMKERFKDIIDVAFTAHMEGQLDQVEEGKVAWKNVLADFYEGFEKDMKEAEEALDGVRLKVPDEVTDEICEVCGRNMVIKNGRFGRFLACPGFPECTNTKPIVEHMPGRCPKCGAGMLKRKSKRGFAYYSCERGAECGFMSWDVPTENDCPVCGQTLFKKSGRGAMKPFCINEKCPNFLPEDKRGYRKKPAASVEAAEAEAAAEEAKKAAEGGETAEKAAKKPAAKKSAAKKTTAAKKPAAKKTTAKKTATKKTAEKKPAAKKPAAAKTTRKTTKKAADQAE